jgi:hypothetical protein
MATTTKSTIVPDPPAASVGRVVATLIGLSNKKVRGMFDHGCVTVNGAPCAHAGDKVHAETRNENMPGRAIRVSGILKLPQRKPTNV